MRIKCVFVYLLMILCETFSVSGNVTLDFVFLNGVQNQTLPGKLEIRSDFISKDIGIFSSFIQGKYIQNFELYFKCKAINNRSKSNFHDDLSKAEVILNDICNRSLYLVADIKSKETEDFADNEMLNYSRSHKSQCALNVNLNTTTTNDEFIVSTTNESDMKENQFIIVQNSDSSVLECLSQSLTSLENILLTLVWSLDRQRRTQFDEEDLQNILKMVKPVIKIKLSKPMCDFDSGCSWKNDSQYLKRWWFDGNTSESMMVSLYEDQLEINKTKDVNEIARLRSPASVTLVSPPILGSSYGCRINFKTVFSNHVGFILQADIGSRLQTIEADRFTNYITKSPAWRTVDIHLGKLNSTFRLNLYLYVPTYPDAVAIDDITLQNCDDGDNETDHKPACLGDEYQCRTGECITQSNVCNLVHNCLFGEDETEERCMEIPFEGKCNFENGSCSMIKSMTNCYGDFVQALTMFQLVDHTKNSRAGHIMLLTYEKCKLGSFRTVDYNPPSQEIQQKQSCKLTMSFLCVGGSALISVKICQRKDCKSGKQITCEPDKQKKWTTEYIPIINISSRYHLNFTIEFIVADKIYLDDIFLTSECFAAVPQSIAERTSIPPVTVTNLSGKGDFDTTVTVKEKTEETRIDIIAVFSSIFGVIFLVIIALILVYFRRKLKVKCHFKPNRHTVRNALVGQSVARFKVGISQVLESSPLMERLEEALAETNLTYDFCSKKRLGYNVKTIPRDHLLVLSELGKGAFGEVVKGVLIDPTNNNMRKDVAIKQLRKLSTEQAKTDLLLEALTLSQFNHPNIITCLGISTDSGFLLLVLELMEGGDMKRFLRINRPSEGSVPVLQTIDLIYLATDIAKGCLYLQKNKFIHRDIAARNCLLSKMGPGRTAKIADFGLAREMYLSNYYRKTTHSKLPVRWMPPESYLDGIFSLKSDIWSYGVLLWEIFTYARLPYPGMSNEDAMVYVSEGKKLSLPPRCPSNIYQIMEECWNLSPDLRPSFDTIGEQLTNINKDLHRSTEFEMDRINTEQRRHNSYESQEPSAIFTLVED